MTAADYEREGGFSDELRDVRQMGQVVTGLDEQKIFARLHNGREREALVQLKWAIDNLRSEIVRTRGEAA